MSTNTLIIVALVGVAAFVVSQRASPEPPPGGAGATPMAQPGFGFNLGFFSNK